MIIGVGIDSLRIARMENAVKREAFLNRVFTENERRYLNGKYLAAQSAAGMFCAKEAVLKALSLGIAQDGSVPAYQYNAYGRHGQRSRHT